MIHSLINWSIRRGPQYMRDLSFFNTCSAHVRLPCFQVVKHVRNCLFLHRDYFICYCRSISALIFSSSLDCQDILFDCRHQLCIIGLTVIQDVSLCSRHLCLDTAGRDRDFRQRREMKGHTEGDSAQEKETSF